MRKSIPLSSVSVEDNASVLSSTVLNEAKIFWIRTLTKTSLGVCEVATTGESVSAVHHDVFMHQVADEKLALDHSLV